MYFVGRNHFPCHFPGWFEESTCCAIQMCEFLIKQKSFEKKFDPLKYFWLKSSCSKMNSVTSSKDQLLIQLSKWWKHITEIILFNQISFKIITIFKIQHCSNYFHGTEFHWKIWHISLYFSCIHCMERNMETVLTIINALKLRVNWMCFL